jgi:hypothetical protein
MSSVWLPCGDYHQNYQEDQGWWQTKFIKGKMILLLLVVFVGIPLLFDGTGSVWPPWWGIRPWGHWAYSC